MADPPEPARKFMRLYPRVSEIQTQVHDYAANLSRESRPLFRVLPSRRRAFSIGDEPDFCRQRFINSDFARICRSKSVAKSRMASVSLADLERLDRISRMILAGDSQCYWLLSALLVQLKEDGYRPSNPSLFDKSISSLSSALATQTNVTSCLSEFITAKRRESYLSHSSFTLPESLKRDLLVAPGTDSLLSSAIENMKEGSLLSSTSSLASISKAAIKSKSQGGSSKYTSPLDAPRAGTLGFRKRAFSPYRRGSKRQGCGSFLFKRQGFSEVGAMSLSNRCLSLRWHIWSDEGAKPWVVEVLREGYRILFRRAPTLSGEPIPFSAYCPSSIRGKALEQEVESLLQKRAIALAPLPSLGYYSRLFVVMKAAGSWWPVIDLPLLNLKVLKTPFKMETIQSTLLSVRRGDWMVSIDLKDAYLQVPIHPDSRKYLRFMAFNKVYQFKVLCFRLSTAPQVFTRVMAPVSAILHTLGIRLRRYLDDWLIQASSREQVLLSLRTVLHLCNSLAIVVNWEKSQLVPTQRICYLGVLLDSVSFRASPAQKRVDKLLSIGYIFLSSVEQPGKSWLELLGVLSSLTQLVPGGRLRMRSFQFVLHRHWDRVDPDALVRWSPEIEQDLRWWLNRDRLELGVSLEQVSPQLDLWSDASDVGWGAHLGGQVVSGLWSHKEAHSSINQRELLAIFYALQHFLPLVRNTSVAVFADNMTALAYLKNQGGTRSAALNRTAQDLLRWTELHSVSLLPQFIMGRNNVLADALSRPNQILGSEWTLKLPVCSDRILTCRIKSIRSPAKVGLVVTDLITSPVVSWEGWETPPPPPAPQLCCNSLLNHRRGKTSLLLW